MKMPRFKTRVRIRAESGELTQVCDPRKGVLAAAIVPEDDEYQMRRIWIDGKEWLVLLLKRNRRLYGLPLHHHPATRSWQRAWEDACVEVMVMHAGRLSPIENWNEL
jgi:hypothetical protein